MTGPNCLEAHVPAGKRDFAQSLNELKTGGFEELGLGSIPLPFLLTFELNAAAAFGRLLLGPCPRRISVDTKHDAITCSQRRHE